MEMVKQATVIRSRGFTKIAHVNRIDIESYFNPHWMFEDEIQKYNVDKPGDAFSDLIEKPWEDALDALNSLRTFLKYNGYQKVEDFSENTCNLNDGLVEGLCADGFIRFLENYFELKPQTKYLNKREKDDGDIPDIEGDTLEVAKNIRDLSLRSNQDKPIEHYIRAEEYLGSSLPLYYEDSIRLQEAPSASGLIEFAQFHNTKKRIYNQLLLLFSFIQLLKLDCAGKLKETAEYGLKPRADRKLMQ